MYCELYSCLVEAEMLEETELVGVILSGGPASVYEEGSPHVNPKVTMKAFCFCVPPVSLPLSLSLTRYDWVRKACLRNHWSIARFFTNCELSDGLDILM